MANELQTIEPIPFPDRRSPTLMQSWPAWVVSLQEMGKSTSQTVGGRYIQTMTLPESRMPTSSQLTAMRGYCDAVDKLCAQTPLLNPAAQRAMLVIVTKMLLALASQKNSEDSSEAKGEAYQMALEDVPYWAVEAAVRGWHRGESPPVNGVGHDHRWAPAPAILRQLALYEASKIKGRASGLRRLMAATPEREYTPEHCATMRERLVEAVRGITGRHSMKGAAE